MTREDANKIEIKLNQILKKFNISAWELDEKLSILMKKKELEDFKLWNSICDLILG